MPVDPSFETITDLIAMQQIQDLEVGVFEGERDPGLIDAELHMIENGRRSREDDRLAVVIKKAVQAALE